MPFIPHTDEDVREMLAVIGAPSIEALFDEIPASLRVQGLPEIPAGLSELEVMQLMAARARQDGRPLCFIGAGAYEHHIPAAVWSIVTRGELYSAYTPYQAEASQGTLQTIYEYQTMIDVYKRQARARMARSKTTAPMTPSRSPISTRFCPACSRTARVSSTRWA